MSEAEWNRIFEIFHTAREREPAEWPAFLDRACADDEDLRAEVESLLASYRASPDFLEGDEILEPLLTLGEPLDDLAGERIGPYRIGGVIGAGGMGVVYAARQEEPIQRNVALKLIKLGMDTREVVGRFESERQALALMDHPSIARVYDAGATEAGRPYFVMERVEGVPITDYCDRSRLSVRRRLELFISVCEAVQHAHQKGIIHRDLKPSNVLVTEQEGRPVPKVIDFGIAKAIDRRLTEETLYTAQGLFVGTPEYMSPEQAILAADVDTRTDVYSLGALLYRVLTGSVPFDREVLESKGLAEVQRVIREDEPPSPSMRVTAAGVDSRAVAADRGTDPAGLRRQLAGELDWIVLMAMDKDRRRRYQTARELAADVQRHLTAQPLMAGPPSRSYRARKFVQRHRVGVAATAVLAALLVAFAAMMTVQSTRIASALQVAERERAEAQGQRARAEQVSDLLVDLFETSDPTKRGETVTAREILDAGAARIGRELEDQPGAQATMMETIGRVYSNLGLYDRAEPLLAGSLETRQQRIGTEQAGVASSLFYLGLLHRETNEYDEAARLLSEALAVRRRIHGNRHAEVARTLLMLGTVEVQRDEHEAAEPLLREALEVQRQVDAENHTVLAKILGELAVVLWRRGEYEPAEPAFRDALAEWEHEPPGLGRAVTLTNFASFLSDRGDFEGALGPSREAHAVAREYLGDGHPVTTSYQNNLALVLYRLGRLDEAETRFTGIVPHQRRAGAPVDLAITLNNVALVRHDRGDLDGAEAALREAWELQRGALGDDHPNVAFHLNNLAKVLHDRGELGSAEDYFRRALAIRREKLPQGHPNTASSLAGLGSLLCDTRDPSAGEVLIREAVAIQRQLLAPGDWRTAETESQLGGCLVALGRYQEAEPLLENGYRVLAGSRWEGDRRIRAALERLVVLYQSWDKPERAAFYREQLAG